MRPYQQPETWQSKPKPRMPKVGEIWQTSAATCTILAVHEPSGCVWVKFASQPEPSMYGQKNWEQWKPPALPLPPALPGFLVFRFRGPRAPFVYRPDDVMRKRSQWITQTGVHIAESDRWFIYSATQRMKEVTLGEVLDLCEDDTDDEDDDG